MNIFIGNIPKQTTDLELQDLFTKIGKVKSTKIIRDMFSGESKGFGFVEMYSLNEAQSAIKELNGYDLNGNKLTVNEARPKTEKNNNRRNSFYSSRSNTRRY